MDFRKKEYRREVFLRFYDFHLKHKSHPGAVYYAIPYLVKKFNLDFEQALWLCYINGCTQNIVTTWRIFNEFSNFSSINEQQLLKWHNEKWRTLDYDIDRRYQKGHLVEMYNDYKSKVGNGSQQSFFETIMDKGGTDKKFDNLFKYVYDNFFMYGRLSTFSYLEYLKIIGVDITCSNLFLSDLEGSKSHRNGLCIVLGLDHADWNKNNEQAKAFHKDPSNVEMLKKEGEILLKEAQTRNASADYFTLESTLCCYKSWHRPDRRYPNVYNDMFYERIVKAEKKGIDCNVFRQMRKDCLPDYMLCEVNKDMMSIEKVKQNWYRTTGEVIMLDYEDKTFTNTFIKKTKEQNLFNYE